MGFPSQIKALFISAVTVQNTSIESQCVTELYFPTGELLKCITNDLDQVQRCKFEAAGTTVTIMPGTRCFREAKDCFILYSCSMLLLKAVK